jgi:hypothetical protein
MKRNFNKQQPSGPSFDVVLKLLELSHELRPDSPFISSLLMQYRKRGGLSKKQLEGLHSKASKIEGIPAQHLATLEAIILKKPTRQKTTVTEQVTPVKKNDDERLVNEILELFPGHKRVLLFKAMLESRKELSVAEQEELKRFYKLLIK